MVAEPSDRGQIELQLTGDPSDGEYLLINGKYYEFEDTEENDGVETGRIKVDIGTDTKETLENLLNAIIENDKLLMHLQAR